MSRPSPVSGYEVRQAIQFLADGDLERFYRSIGLSQTIQDELGAARPTPVRVAVSANTDDAAWGAASGYLVNCTGAFDLTGLVAGVYDLECRWLVNSGTGTLTLRSQSGSSAAANRFLTEGDADKAVGPRQSAQLVYDQTAARWRVVL